jgi:hypothetical protein
MPVVALSLVYALPLPALLRVSLSLPFFDQARPDNASVSLCKLEVLADHIFVCAIVP